MLKLSLEEMKGILSDADLEEEQRQYAIGIIVSVFERANENELTEYETIREPTLIAVYKPKSLIPTPNNMLSKSGMKCTWTYAFTINGVDYYETKDLKFCSIDAFPITDLELKDEDCKINHTCSCDNTVSDQG